MDYSKLISAATDPIVFAKLFWPHVFFYDKQIEVIKSVEENDETFVVAGNMLGKDFVAGFIVLRFFLVHALSAECRVVATSVKDDHLRVLFGEIERFIQTSVIPLTVKDGGPLVVKHRDIGKIDPRTKKLDKISYIRGMVSERGEGLAGHHASYTLAVIDEASGVDNVVYTQMGTWAKRFLVFGNPNPCPQTHFFYKAVTEGDILVED